MSFVGDGAGVDVTSDRRGDEPGLDRWLWEHLEQIDALAVPFDCAVYEQVAKPFCPLAGAA